MGFRLNDKICMMLYSKGIYHGNFEFLKLLFDHMKENDIRLNNQLKLRIETELLSMKKTIINKVK